ncbi:AUX/IAA transcriptional regulator family protein, putative isoform 2 [Hibiscus syriacus]|uniref:Auxin-responsive protein n=1 Tax=Hibiscus syriacus TaxID=106335 RepID=A0A6A2YCE8_HIBSY|nr:auxin-responsive protein IAA9-like [Hibiscus syriacus]KAE8675876.1 AUX/IAA transcriptional regulator family protein, putative isoform 2 [Hibiscus syriacus]
MELQLGLAPPTPLVPMEMLDLSSHGCQNREAKGSNASSWPLLKLGPSDIGINTNNNSSSISSSNGGGCDSKNSCFDEAALLFDERRSVPKTLPLLHWSDQPNDEDNPKELDDNSSSSSSIFRNDGENLVGWPPVKTSRKTQGHQISDGVADNPRTMAAETVANGRGGRASKSTYVKVKMERVAIARKIDVSVHHSFEVLNSTVMRMFGIPAEHRESFKLSYQDREGDWKFAEDVPWRTLIRSLKCLKLIRCRG